jgi:hypothetical protein
MLFPQLQGMCQSIPRKDGARSSLFLISEVCCSILFVSIVVLCIVCVLMCTVLLPPGGYPIAVKYIILYIIYHIHSLVFSP